MHLNQLNISAKFSFAVGGCVETSREELYIFTNNGEQLRVFPIPKSYSAKQQLWHLLPMVNSTGIISSVQVLSTSPSEVEQFDSGKCVLVGKILQVSKRTSVVLFEVELSKGKLFKVTLANPDPRMKAEQVWSVTAQLIDSKLQITQALPLTPIESEPQPEPVEAAVPDEPIGANAAAPTQKAIDALHAETGVVEWELSSPRSRSGVWEWEAISPQTGLKARVAINSDRVVVHQFTQDTAPTAPLTNTERLVVTALGAARGIGASCFQVLIGPYEVVLDCGTRPKGSKALPALEYLENPNLCLVSHAHSDHIGSLPVFHALFPTARMICTPGTREIARVMLTDGLKVQQANEENEPLFDELELERALFCLETEPIGREFEPLPGLKVVFINAGHIVGAACIYLKYGDRSLLYTGDYNAASTRTTTGLKLSDLPEADMLITRPPA